MIVAGVRRRFIAADANKGVLVATRFIALNDGTREYKKVGGEERGNTEKLPALRNRCGRCAAAVKKGSGLKD